MTHDDPDVALQRLCARHAMAFGERLLTHAQDGSVTFREFVLVAREMVTALPEQTATWLAAMVALDMREDQRRAEWGLPWRN